MTEGTEHSMEYVISGLLFCMALTMLLWLHGAFLKQTRVIGTEPERLILMEQEG